MLDLDAGAYAPFLWPAYGISAAVLLWLVVDSLAKARRWRGEVDRLEGRLEAKAPGAAETDADA